MKISSIIAAVAITFGAVNVEAQKSILGKKDVLSQSGKASTEETWRHHINAWSSRDITDILSDYDETSLIVINGKKYGGLSEIRLVFESLFRIFDNGQNRIDPVLIDERLVYITWHFMRSDRVEFFGTDTFLIEDGKIKIQTIASPLYGEF